MCIQRAISYYYDEHFDIKDNKILASFKKNGSLNHTIPCIFISYWKNNSFIKIQAKCKYFDKIKKINFYLCDPKLLLEVLNSGYNFYLSKFNDEEQSDNNNYTNNKLDN